ncbi:MAG: hypothetical protein H0U40_05720 [Chloroflexia bacterium]|nr:hypothetical protein [Chloroflexia bacterium]
MAALVLRRAWVLLACAAVAAAAAWFLGPREAPREKTLIAFVLRPNLDTPAEGVPDTLRSTGGTNSQLTRTVARVIETDRILDAVLRAGVPPGDYELTSSLEPGTDVITVEVSAREGVSVDPLIVAYSREASKWVLRAYKAYTLQFLESTPVPSAGPDVRAIQVTGLAALAGALLGLLLVFAEFKLRGLDLLEAREDVARPPADAGPPEDTEGESLPPDWQETDLDRQEPEFDGRAEERVPALSAAGGERRGGPPRVTG